MNICSVATVRALGWDPKTLLPIKARLFGASRGAEIQLVGGIILEIQPPGGRKKEEPPVVRLFYVSTNVTRTYLSLSTLKAMGVVDQDFPRFRQERNPIPITVTAAVTTAPEPPVLNPQACTNTGVVMPGEKPCQCPKRAPPPRDKPKLPAPATKENLPLLKKYILDRYAASAFNCCEHQALPMMKGGPGLQLHINPNAKPVAVHKPAVVPIHWQEPVLEGLLRDVRLGVLERVPVNTPVTWQSRMVVTPKHDGSPLHGDGGVFCLRCRARQAQRSNPGSHLVTFAGDGEAVPPVRAVDGAHRIRTPGGKGQLAC